MKLISIAEAAKLMGWSRLRVERAIEEGQLRPLHIGSKRMLQLEEVQALNARLQSSYDNKIDLNVIEEKALALGMTLPNNKQTIYLDLEGSDKAVILEAEEENVVGTAWQAIVRSVKTLREYFS